MNLNQKRLRPLLTGLLALVWLLTVFIGYIYIHKPFSAMEFAGILAIVWRTVVALAIISLAGGIGSLTKLRDLDLPPLTLAALTAGLGLGIISITVLVIGASIGINAFLWVVFLAALILLRKPVFSWWKYWQAANQLWEGTSRFARTILALTIVILICQYVIALAPPLQFDALMYHLAIPKAYLQLGRITYLPDTIFWGMPEQVEMLYTLAMSIGGAESATVLGWWIGFLTLAGLAGYTERLFSSDAACVAVASLMCASGLTISLSSGYVEWTTMLFGLAMSVCLIQWALNRDQSTLILAGLFAGMALGTKYTAGVALLAGCVVVLFFQKPYSLKQIVTNLIIFGGTAVIITLPWWLRNILATSNPFYPFLIPAGAMDTTYLALLQYAPTHHDWSRLALLAWQITIWGADGKVGFSTSIGPLLLGLSILTPINWHERSFEQHLATKIAGTVLITSLVTWAIASQFSGLLIQTRLFLTIFPTWAMLGAAGYMAILLVRAENIRFSNIAKAFILLALIFNAFPTVVNVLKSGAFLAALNPEMRDTYIKNNLGEYQSAIQELTALPENSRVVMLWETRGFECQPMCDSDEIIRRWSHDWTIYRTPAAIIEAWKAQGYTHLLINRFGADFVRTYTSNGPSAEAWQGLTETIETLTLVKTIGKYELYSIP